MLWAKGASTGEVNPNEMNIDSSEYPSLKEEYATLTKKGPLTLQKLLKWGEIAMMMEDEVVNEEEVREIWQSHL